MGTGKAGPRSNVGVNTFIYTYICMLCMLYIDCVLVVFLCDVSQPSEDLQRD